METFSSSKTYLNRSSSSLSISVHGCRLPGLRWNFKFPCAELDGGEILVTDSVLQFRDIDNWTVC
jgi:hypothetical protein